LDMGNAMKNAMSGGIKDEKPHEPINVYKNLVVELTDAAGRKKKGKVEKLIPKVLEISKTIDDPTCITSAFLVISICYNMLSEVESSLSYADQAMATAKQMESTSNSHLVYPLWRSAILMKGAVLLSAERTAESLELYEELAEKAILQSDFFFAVEGYRVCSSVQENEKNWQESFEYALLGLYAGSQMELDMRKGSTFPLVMKMAHESSEKIELSKEKLKILHYHFVEWMGENWLNEINEATSLIPVDPQNINEKII